MSFPRIAPKDTNWFEIRYEKDCGSAYTRTYTRVQSTLYWYV